MNRITISIIITGFVLITVPSVIKAGHPAKSGEYVNKNVTTIDLSKFDTYLGAPLIKDRKETLKNEGRLEMIVPLTHDEIVKLYEEVYKGNRDIKFRRWKDSTYIEDDGALQWHSITVDKAFDNGTKVLVVKDNWTWITSTLVLRFIAVFIVLCILYVFLATAGKIISRQIEKMESK